MSALAAGFIVSSIVAVPISSYAAEAANESGKVLKMKSPAETYAAQGQKLFDEGKFKEAGEAYEKAAEEAKNNDEYWFMCGFSLFKAESYRAASGALKKALKLKPNEGLYNCYYGLSLWNLAIADYSIYMEKKMDQGDQYVKRAAELMPNDVNVQMTAGTIAENYANYLVRTGGYRSYINEEYKRAYRHFRRAAEIDSSKIENLNRFVSEHSEYGFQSFAPSAPVSGVRNVTPSGGVQTGGDLIIPPIILPADDSNEVYDLTQIRVRYVSQGYYGAEESTFVLSYEKSADTANIGKVVPMEREHGAYLMKNDIHVPLIDDFSFDYDEASQTFTIYDGGGKGYTVRYDYAGNTMIVNHIWDSARSGTYVYDATVPGYIMYAGNQKILPHVATLVTEFHGEGEYNVPYRNGLVCEVVPYPEENSDHNGLPDMWYKMTDENNNSDWEAFTYDNSNGIFTCYYDDQGEIKHVYRKFLDGNQLGRWKIGEDLNGPPSSINVREADGIFWNGNVGVHKYITDGMLIFLHYVIKE